jgi:uncharacterized LabA/DUF88 family protein
MNDKSLCRIGVFYDGSYFSYAQIHFYADDKLGWMMFTPFHAVVENFIREKEQGYFNYRVVYAGWYQGLYTSGQSNDHQRRVERNRHIDLMHAGVEPKYVPMSQAQGEKGVDIALAIDALQVGLEDKIDIAVLVTGDGDFVPLVRALMKNGVRVAVAYFEYESEKGKSFANERLLSVSNYSLNVNSLEKDRKNQGMFRGLFRQPEKGKEGQDAFQME